jgi:hypothetical protein
MDLGYEEAVTVADLRLSPLWDPLRDHPRFHALVGEDRDEEEG